eukprot:scaffold38143_cov57-Phaeocystis_antarctica.AAC.1
MESAPRRGSGRPASAAAARSSDRRVTAAQHWCRRPSRPGSYRVDALMVPPCGQRAWAVCLGLLQHAHALSAAAQAARAPNLHLLLCHRDRRLRRRHCGRRCHRRRNRRRRRRRRRHRCRHLLRLVGRWQRLAVWPGCPHDATGAALARPGAATLGNAARCAACRRLQLSHLEIAQLPQLEIAQLCKARLKRVSCRTVEACLDRPLEACLGFEPTSSGLEPCECGIPPAARSARGLADLAATAAGAPGVGLGLAAAGAPLTTGPVRSSKPWPRLPTQSRTASHQRPSASRSRGATWLGLRSGSGLGARAKARARARARAKARGWGCRRRGATLRPTPCRAATSPPRPPPRHSGLAPRPPPPTARRVPRLAGCGRLARPATQLRSVPMSTPAAASRP